ncbi:hypothetical protein Tco_0116118 [Tanacetum coccineum]
MAISSSSSDNELYDDSYCSKSCRKNTENLTTKISKLREELYDSESDLCNYKRGLSQVEARLVEFKINESKFCEKIRVLERDLELKDYKIENLTNELEKVKKERDGIDSKLEKFVNSSKNLDQMLETQRSVKDKMGLGLNEYSVVPPPPAQVYSSPMPDLSWTGLPEFADNTVTDYTRPTPSVDVTNDVRSKLDGNNMIVCKHGGTSSNAVSKPISNFVKESGCPNVIKINNIENARKPTAKYAELYRNITQSSNVRSNNFGPLIIEDWDSEDESDTEATPIESIRSTINQNRDQPRGNQRNWNNLKSQHLGKDFVMQNKACYKCGSFEHLKVNCNKNMWVNKGKNWSRANYTQGNLTPKAILLKSGTKTIAPNRSFSTARTFLNGAQPKMKSFDKSAHSNVKRPFERKAVAKNKIWVPTARTKNPTVGLKVPTAKPTVAAVKGNKGKAVKASARWIWKPKQISGEGSNVNGVSGKPLDNIDDKGFWDSGCSRHMTGNISYLSDYEPYDGGYVSFRYGSGKISGKGTIKIGKLEFENVHFVKELKYNLDFKLEDDRHVLLRTPRQIPPVAIMEMLHAQADLIESMQSFLMKYDHIPHNEKSIKFESEIDREYERDCEIRIQKLKQDFNIWGSEVRKKEKAYEDEKYAAACRYMLSVTCDDDDDDNLGFYAVHPNTIHIPVSQNVEPKDRFIMGVDEHYQHYSGKRRRLVLAHLAPISPEIVEACVDDDDTYDDDYDDDFYDCVDIEEEGGEIDLDISKIVDISLREKLVESYLLIEKINAFSLSPPIPISPILCPSSTIPVVDIDLPLEEADVPSFSDNSILRGIESDRDSGEDTTSIDDLPLDDSMILPEYESFTFDDEPVMAEVNVFDEINTSELSYPVLPKSTSTGSEDKVFNPGIFDNDAFKDKSSKELAPSKALLTLDVFDPLHPPLMNFNVFPDFGSFMVQYVKDKANPTISIDDLHLHLHKWKGLKRQKEAKTDQKPTRNERDKNKSEEQIKDHSRISPTQQEMKSRVKLKAKDQE